MAHPYLEKPKPSRSLPLFDLKRPRRAHTLPHLVPHAKSTGLSFAHHQERPDAYLPCYITATNSARQALQIRSFSGQRPLFCGSPELRSAPLNSMLTLATMSKAQPFPISSWTASHLIALRPRSTKPLGYEACAVGPDEVSEESVHLL
jgi:hypothetical protein